MHNKFISFNENVKKNKSIKKTSNSDNDLKKIIPKDIQDKLNNVDAVKILKQTMSYLDGVDPYLNKIFNILNNNKKKKDVSNNNLSIEDTICVVKESIECFEIIKETSNVEYAKELLKGKLKTNSLNPKIHYWIAKCDKLLGIKTYLNTLELSRKLAYNQKKKDEKLIYNIEDDLVDAYFEKHNYNKAREVLNTSIEKSGYYCIIQSMKLAYVDVQLGMETEAINTCKRILDECDKLLLSYGENSWITEIIADVSSDLAVMYEWRDQYLLMKQNINRSLKYEKDPEYRKMLFEMLQENHKSIKYEEEQVKFEKNKRINKQVKSKLKVINCCDITKNKSL